MRGLIKFVVVLVLIVVLAGAAGWWYIAGRGVSAHDEPTWLETVVARRFRTLAVPRDLRGKPNPLPASPKDIEAGLAHFADHCAVCHANNGRGDTTIGRNLYPKAPDMRAVATQSLTDGELFAIIEHGVRLTGMPAWGGDGSPEGERLAWQLVLFIRHLPKLTTVEEEQMKALNPKTAAEWREQDARERAAGQGAATSGPKPPPHTHDRPHE